MITKEYKYVSDLVKVNHTFNRPLSRKELNLIEVLRKNEDDKQVDNETIINST